LSAGEPRVTAAGKKASASLLNQIAWKDPLKLQISDYELRAAKLQRSRINQLWRFDPRLASRWHHSPLATKYPACSCGQPT